MSQWLNFWQEAVNKGLNTLFSGDNKYFFLVMWGCATGVCGQGGKNAPLMQLQLVSSTVNKLETWNIRMKCSRQKSFFSRAWKSRGIVIPRVRCNEVLSRHLSALLIYILCAAVWTGNRAKVCQTTAESSLIGNPCVQRAWQDNYLPPFVSHAALSRHICWFLLFLLLLCFNNKAIPANHGVFAYKRGWIT